jgi:Ankyrin repeats (3 copies)/Ankyrin repeat
MRYDTNVDAILACLNANKLLHTLILEDDERPLLVAVRRGDVHAVQTLIALGADTDVQGHYNTQWSPLHIAAEEGHEAIVDVLLLQKNVAVDARIRHFAPDRSSNTNLDGATALHIATLKGHFRVAEKLLDHGANAQAEIQIPNRLMFSGATSLDLVLLPGLLRLGEGDHPEWLHPDRLSMALKLIKKGARFSSFIAKQWNGFQVDEVLERFAGHQELWDAFFAHRRDE